LMLAEALPPTLADALPTPEDLEPGMLPHEEARDE